MCSIPAVFLVPFYLVFLGFFLNSSTAFFCEFFIVFPGVALFITNIFFRILIPLPVFRWCWFFFKLSTIRQLNFSVFVVRYVVLFGMISCVFRLLKGIDQTIYFSWTSIDHIRRLSWIWLLVWRVYAYAGNSALTFWLALASKWWWHFRLWLRTRLYYIFLPQYLSF